MRLVRAGVEYISEQVRPSSGCPRPCRSPPPSARNSGCNIRDNKCLRLGRRSDSSSLTSGGTRRSWSNACATRDSSRSSARQRTRDSRSARTRARRSASARPEALHRCWKKRFDHVSGESRRKRENLIVMILIDWFFFFFFRFDLRK